MFFQFVFFLECLTKVNENSSSKYVTVLRSCLKVKNYPGMLILSGMENQYYSLCHQKFKKNIKQTNKPKRKKKKDSTVFLNVSLIICRKRPIVLV